MATVPTYLAALGFTEIQLNNAYENRKDDIDAGEFEAMTKPLATAILVFISDAGSVKNAGGPLAIARKYGCSYYDAVKLCDSFHEFVAEKRAE